MCPPPPGAANTSTATIAAPSAHEQLFDQMMENLKNKYDSVAPVDLAKELGNGAGGPKPLVIDVRPADQYADMHVPGAINLPQAELNQRKGELPADINSPIVMVCGIGKFSKHTTLFLKSLGYRNVRSMKGGINEWVRKQQPVEKSP
jgi:rhodanese-related sulfurtransferase